jgi:hypothetical protein
MRQTILILTLCIFILSCGQNESKQKELELREREIAIKEKELALKQKDSVLPQTNVSTKRFNKYQQVISVKILLEYGNM